MGIKGFSAWLRTTFPQVFCPIPVGVKGNGKTSTSSGGSSLNFDQVYVDLNPFLHISARQSSCIDDVMKGCRKNLRSALQTVTRPKSLVYVSMDGPAPLAKLPEQRARRQDAAISAARKGTFDAQQLTPGCLAMTSLESQIYTLLRELFFASSSQDSDFAAVLDGSCVDGEGEFKIIRKILHDHVEGDALKGRVTRAILACDADLFLQALLSDVPHLYLIDPFAPYQSSTAVFSVDRWRRALSAESSTSNNISETEGRQIAFDFVLFALMSGSDYAPALRYANYRSLWPNYLEFMRSRTNGAFKRIRTTGIRTIVDPTRQSVDMQHLQDFFKFYLEHGLTESLREPLKTFHDELDPCGRSERILNYIEHLLWNLDALVTCNVPDLSISMLTEKTAPSLLELADFDVEVLQAALAERMKAAVNPEGLGDSTPKCPGVMALMALDRSGTDCLDYLAAPLKPIMNELRFSSEKSVYSDLSDSALFEALNERIEAIPRESFSLVERLATFPRSPITLTRSIVNTPEAANFYTMALRSASDSKEPNLLRLPWLRPYVYAVNEEESFRCPLHKKLFGKYKSF